MTWSRSAQPVQQVAVGVGERETQAAVLGCGQAERAGAVEQVAQVAGGDRQPFTAPG
jgi:hypothetical protein